MAPVYRQRDPAAGQTFLAGEDWLAVYRLWQPRLRIRRGDATFDSRKGPASHGRSHSALRAPNQFVSAAIEAPLCDHVGATCPRDNAAGKILLLSWENNDSIPSRRAAEFGDRQVRP